MTGESLTNVATLCVAFQGWALRWTLAALAGVVVVSVLLTAPLRKVLEKYIRYGDPALVSVMEADVRVEVYEKDGNRAAWLHTADDRAFELPEGFGQKRADGRFRLFLACSSGAIPGMQYDDPKESLEAMEPLSSRKQLPSVPPW